jgi:uncharacterized protein YbbK (DUF523 family)/uncharacterized protein YbgA (DUF1722 family)
VGSRGNIETATSIPVDARSSRRIRLGVSACLLGDRVRYDGGDKHSLVVERLGRFVDWVKVCPEVESGMGTPREPVHLVRESGGIRLLTVHTRVDQTERMRAFAAARLETLAAEDLCGYVLKDSSPSCGSREVKLHGGDGSFDRTGVGLFAAALAARFPGLPLEEAERLQDAGVRDHFLDRVLTYRQLQDFFASNWRRGALVRFHASYKLTLMAHSIPVYKELGQLVARSQTLEREALRSQYIPAFMTAMTTSPSVARHVNVLQHVAGYFKRELDAGSRARLQTAIEEYRQDRVSLFETIALFRRHARQLGAQYLLEQVYLQPREQAWPVE